MADLTLKQRIATMIAHTGPMPLADYMQLCLFDPEQGYYSNETAIGSAGDFVTAPQVSQMFGELIGVWCASVWEAMDRPDPFILAEAGPGHGTMMADMLRATASVKGFRRAARVRLIEAGATMANRQRKALAGVDADIEWMETPDRLPDGPLILVANEFLDCLPVRQFVKAGPVWRERCIGQSENGELSSVLGSAVLDADLLPADADREPDGAVFERAPAREAWTADLAARLAAGRGAALLIDYGHDRPGFGDTFQAMRGHAYADPLAEPGAADLTAHVDFEAVSRAASNEGTATSSIVAQGEFLPAMGLLERAGALGAGKPVEVQEGISDAVERLAGPRAMGKLFKVLALADHDTAQGLSGLPPFTAETKRPD